MKLSTREWILSIIIISVIQGFIWYASFVNAGNGSSLNYVSFAGTLISIILAVLAIGYTYGDSLSQKSQTNGVNEKIAILNEVLKNIQIESSNLDKISEISQQLIHFDESIKSHLDSTNTKFDGISEALSSIKENSGKDDKSENLDDTIFLKVAKPNKIVNQVLYLCFLQMDGNIYKGNLHVVEEVLDSQIDELSQENDKDYSTYLHILTGMIISSISVYNSINVIDKIEIDENYFKISLNSEFKNKIIKNISDSEEPKVSGSFFHDLHTKLLASRQSV